MTSYASLTTLVRTRGSDDVDPVEVAADWTPRLRAKVVGALEFRKAHDHPDAVFYDMFFEDFVADQFEEISKIYEALDLPMSDQGASAMRTYIAEHPKGVDGIHRYEPEEYGIDPAAVRREFAPYIEHFDLRPE
jgi:hypothetical protein